MNGLSNCVTSAGSTTSAFTSSSIRLFETERNLCFKVCSISSRRLCRSRSARENMNIEELFYMFVQEELFDHHDRPKTVKALQTLCDRVPEEVFRRMPSCSIFAPAADIFGAVHTMPPIVVY